MGKLIRRTITITITETWTFIWTTDGDPLSHPSIILQAKPKEEQDEAFQTIVNNADPGKPSVSDPTATPLTPAALVDPLPDGAPSSSSTSRQRKRSRSRRTGSNPQSI